MWLLWTHVVRIDPGSPKKYQNVCGIFSNYLCNPIHFTEAICVLAMFQTFIILPKIWLYNRFCPNPHSWPCWASGHTWLSWGFTQASFHAFTGKKKIGEKKKGRKFSQVVIISCSHCLLLESVPAAVILNRPQPRGKISWLQKEAKILQKWAPHAFESQK